MRAALRSYVFHVLLALIALAVFVLPISVSGDGTAAGQLQISLTYSLGVVTALVSISALWLSASSLAREIEGYQIHLVASKPVPRHRILLGKWLGIVGMNAGLFLAAAAVILGLSQWRLRHSGFGKQELEKLRNEVLVGRRVYRPLEPNFLKIAEAEFQRRKKSGQLQSGYNKTYLISQFMSQAKAKAAEVRYRYTRAWKYTGIKKPADNARVFVHYRMYVGSTTSLAQQRQTQGAWAILDPTSPHKDAFIQLPAQKVMTGQFHEFAIPGRFISKEGELVLAYTNLDPRKATVMFQLSDGPEVLLAATGFLNNYARSAALVLLQVAFLAALGCTVGALFSTPVALFVAASYIVLGFTVRAALQAPLRNDLGQYEYRNAAEHAAHLVAQAVNAVIVTPDEFDTSGSLARGRLIPGKKLAHAFFDLVLLRGLLLALLGVYFFQKRELGAVIRR